MYIISYILGRKISRVEGNLIYNYGDPYETDIHGDYNLYKRDRGKYTKSCLGIPSVDKLDKHFIYNSKYNRDAYTIENNITYVNEDSEQGM